MTERIAIIDLGSNSARLIIMHIYNNNSYNLVYHQKETVRLSTGMGNDRVLRLEAMERAIRTLQVFSHMCQLFQVDTVMAVATAAVRNAKNGAEFLVRARRETGIPIQAVSGETEAILGLLGVMNTIDAPDCLLMDLGGGSTELTLVRGRKAIHSLSLPFGAINLTELYHCQDKITDTDIDALRDFIFKQLQQVPWLGKLHLPILAIGGTARNIAKIDQKIKNYVFPKIHNYRLGRIAFEQIWRKLYKLNLRQRKKVPGLNSDRADIIVAGSTIIQCLFEYTRGDNLIVSGCGVREGLFMRYYLSRDNQAEIIPDILMHSARNIMSFYKADPVHANHVTRLSLQIYDGLQPLHNMDQRQRCLLTVAGLLHDIGITINYYSHARHSAYLVENARLFGMTHREQLLTAVIVGWHNGPSIKYVRRLHNEFLDQVDWDTARKLSCILAMAESLDVTQMGLVHAVEVDTNDNQVVLKLIASDSAVIERQWIAGHRKQFQQDFGIPLIIC